MWQTTSYAGVQPLTAQAITVPWNEETLTWNNRPAGSITMGTGNTSSTYNVWIGLNVTDMVYAWWQGGLANNGLEVHYANESQACDFFASDNYGSGYYPQLSIDYVQDLAGPGGSLSINGGNQYTNTPWVSYGAERHTMVAPPTCGIATGAVSTGSVPMGEPNPTGM